MMSISTSSTPDWRGPERRQSDGRRQYSIGTLWTSLVRPRRMSGRRRCDRRYPMLDRFDSGMLTLALALMVFSVLDSIFTLTLLARGGTELNPVMNVLLGHSVWAFVGVKMLMTSVPAVILVGTGNLLLYGLIRARTLLATLVGLYAGLVVYEILLLTLA